VLLQFTIKLFPLDRIMQCPLHYAAVYMVFNQEILGTDTDRLDTDPVIIGTGQYDDRSVRQVV